MKERKKIEQFNKENIKSEKTIKSENQNKKKKIKKFKIKIMKLVRRRDVTPGPWASHFEIGCIIKPAAARNTASS